MRFGNVLDMEANRLCDPLAGQQVVYCMVFHD